MKYTFFAFVIIAFLFPYNSSGQTASSLLYVYDNSGNRVGRTIEVPLKVVQPQNDTVHANQQDSVSAANNFALIPDSINGGDNTQYVDNIGGQQIIVYPNPTFGVLKVQINPYPQGAKVEINLFDFQNKLLLHTSCTNEITSLDLSAFPNGSYLMYIWINGQVSNWKIIKE